MATSEHAFEVATKGYGTYKYAGTPNDVTLEAMLAAAGLAAIPDGCDGFDLYVVSSAQPLYYENDGTAASADSFPIDVGVGPKYRRARAEMTGGKFRFFSAGAQDIRIQLVGTSSAG